MFTDDWAKLDESGRHLALTAAVLRTAESEMVLSHVTGAVAHKAPIWNIPLTRVHATRTDGRAGRRTDNVAQHKGELPAHHRTTVHEVPVTSPARTCFDLTTMAGVEQSLCVIDNLLHRKLVSPDELTAICTELRRTPGSLATDLAFRLADGRSESVGETRSRYMFWRQGLPMPEPQYKIYDHHGHIVARVDFAWPALGLFVEFDGRVKYERLLKEGESATDVVVREKEREDLVCRLTQWRCHRLVWADLRRPQETCGIIRGMFRQPAA
jgi:hypothetical protein